MLDFACFFCIHLSSITSVFTSNSFDIYLANYWPISNSLMNDVIGTADMILVANTTFTADRFGNPNSALNLNGGYTQVPAGAYFNRLQFSISVWIYPASIGSSARILDFGNGRANDNIIFAFSYGFSNASYFTMYNGVTFIGSVRSSALLKNDVWHFLVATFDTIQINLYINGTLVGSSRVTNYIETVTRTLNYIGKSNWANDEYSYSYIDDLRFYRIKLSQSEIIELMTQSGTSSTTTTTVITAPLSELLTTKVYTLKYRNTSYL